MEQELKNNAESAPGLSSGDRLAHLQRIKKTSSSESLGTTSRRNSPQRMEQELEKNGKRAMEASKEFKPALIQRALSSLRQQTFVQNGPQQNTQELETDGESALESSKVFKPALIRRALPHYRNRPLYRMGLSSKAKSSRRKEKMHQTHIPRTGQLFFTENCTPQNCDAPLERTGLNGSISRFMERVYWRPASEASWLFNISASGQ